MLLLLGRGIAYADVAVIHRLDSFSRLVNSYGPHSGCPVFTSHTRILSYEADRYCARLDAQLILHFVLETDYLDPYRLWRPNQSARAP
jgi:hypothetical protein